MSYILQALRRSEQARGAPTEAPPIPVATPDLAEEPRRPIVWAMAALLVLALAGGVAYYFHAARGTTSVVVPAAPVLRKPAEPVKIAPPAPVADATPAETSGAGLVPSTAEPPPALKPSPFVEQPSERVEQPGQDSGVRDLAEQIRVPPPPPPRSAKATPARPRETVIPGPVPAAAPPVARVDDGVKFLRAMPPDFQRDLPALVVNIHIYSSNEADRILYINNRQYQAGDKVREDIRIEAIVEDGAVLSFRGQRFKLPRPS